MKNLRAPLAATAIPLLLTSLPLAAGELPFNAPTTARAQESAQLLHDAARALGDLPTARDQHIANLWIFPTANADTVVAQYDLVSNQEGPASASHLTVLTLRDNRIVERTELPDSRRDERSATTATPHWSALIGTGHAASTEATTSSHGVPATPDWTARIGTGAAASSVVETQQQPSSNKQSAVADAHWTSKIGTGHAAESNARQGT